ncbi:Uma2 family endonuclease [Spirosoma spitsbergense]|uniref:Uma2 family endonuclease n=1 Tax=Spirosoma spitsbergense TaxID=431554 RepID=UPI00037D7B90|nr:Uma2 family endonuclease [Spirosoma spitsbergense]
MEAVVELSEYEVERGKPTPSKNHSIIQSNLLVALATNYGKQYRFLSEISLETPRFVPDIGIFPPMRFDPLHDQTKLNQVPVGVIEIISPSQTQEELVEKARQYFAAGVQSYWLVNPIFSIVHIMHSPDTYQNVIEGTLTDEKLGISLEMSELFR